MHALHCNRPRYAVKVPSASSSDWKTCAFSHLAPSRALNDSMCGLSVGFPGRLKSSLTSSRQAHASKARKANSIPLSTWITADLR